MNKKITKQEKFWSSQFGVDYLDRNIYSPAQLDKFYENKIGTTMSKMNDDFLGNKKINNVLEVGCNIGNQLNFLQKKGYKNLFGIEISENAVEKSKIYTKNINIIQGSGFDIPFKDNYFDLVFTAGVLIHINPNDLKKIMKEIHRVSKKFVMGFEYYNDKSEEILYRKNKGYLWKNNFSQVYLNNFNDLKLIKEKKYQYKDNSNNVDTMFLLKKY